MANDLVHPDELEGFPGAPFTEEQVDAAVAALRRAAGWHIAPVREETVTLDVTRMESRLRLPTRHLLTVDEVRDVAAEETVDEADYRVSLPKALVWRASGYWPEGYGAVEVDFTHGYAECPPDVLAVVAMAAQRVRSDVTVRSVSVDDFSVERSAASVDAMVRAHLDSSYLLSESLYGVGIA